MPTRPHDELIIEELRNPEFAAEYLNSVMETKNAEYISHALSLLMISRGEHETLHIPQETFDDIDEALTPSHLRIRFEASPAL